MQTQDTKHTIECRADELAGGGSGQIVNHARYVSVMPSMVAWAKERGLHIASTTGFGFGAQTNAGQPIHGISETTNR